MFSTVEISQSAIRIVQCSKDSVEDIDEFPVPDDADPIQTLGTVALSSALGAVRVVIHHEDMLLGSITQAPCPHDRLARLIEFEMKSNLGDQVDTSLINWYVSPTGGTGDMRILTAVTKRNLVERIEESLKVHKGKLVSLVHPALGLFENWNRQDQSSSAVLIDVGGHHLHIAIVEAGELLFMRTYNAGMNDLAKDISELRSIDIQAARDLMGKINKNAPDDIKEIIHRHASGLVQQINNVVRFAQAQLKIGQIEYDRVVFSGAGARVPFLIDSCSKNMNTQSVVFNPFPIVASSLPPTQMDVLSELPSPWGPALGTAQAETVKLDGLHQIHRETKEFRETSGILRLAAAIAVALLLWSFINQQIVTGTTDSALQTLEGNGAGLVPSAEAKDKQIKALKDQHGDIANKAHFIDGERRPGRIAHELLAAITNVQDQQHCPISLQSMKVERPGNGLVVVEIYGRAQSVDRLDTATVISRFEEGLQKELPIFKTPMTNLQPDKANTPNGYHAFAYRLEFPDNL